MRVMIIGASTNPQKFGNKAVRAYQRMGGNEIFPVNPRADVIEGERAYHTIAEVPGPIDRALFYVPSEIGMQALEELAQRGGDVGEVWFNPGSESPELIKRAGELGFDPIMACSIVDIGQRP